MVALVATAKTFSCRPSELLAIEDPVLALAVDLAGAQRLMSEAGEQGQAASERVEW